MDENACKEMLLEMGFPLQKIIQALFSTGSKNIEELINWMDQNETFEEFPTQFDNPTEPIKNQIKMPSNNETKIYKCKICEKVFKDEDLAAIHTSKTNHSDFDESIENVKPLSEEDKIQKVAELQKMIEERRVVKCKQDEEEEQKKELERRKQGKEFVSVKEKLREQEALKIAEERKREKLEEKMARQRVKELIEKDKLDRMQKFNYSNADKEVLDKTSDGETIKTTSNNHAISTEIPVGIKKEYDKCDLQIRLTDGNTLKHTFGAQEELAAVRLYVLMNSPLLQIGIEQDSNSTPTSQISLMTPFPKKIFTEDDMRKPLAELGLVPKAVITVTKSKTNNF